MKLIYLSDDNVWMETLVCISKSGDNVKEDDLKTLLEKFVVYEFFFFWRGL